MCPTPIIARVAAEMDYVPLTFSGGVPTFARVPAKLVEMATAIVWSEM